MADTIVYLVRHAQSDFSVREEMIRPLTPEGWESRPKVTECLWNEGIEAIYSSPYKRALDTISDFAGKKQLPVVECSGLGERGAGTGWVTVEEFWYREEKSWHDPAFVFEGEESIGEVRARICPAFDQILSENIGRKIAVAGHGTAFSVLLNSLDPTFDFEDYRRLCPRNPWIIKLTFRDKVLASREEML